MAKKFKKPFVFPGIPDTSPEWLPGSSEFDIFGWLVFIIGFGIIRMKQRFAGFKPQHHHVDFLFGSWQGISGQTTSIAGGITIHWTCPNLGRGERPELWISTVGKDLRPCRGAFQVAETIVVKGVWEESELLPTNSGKANNGKQRQKKPPN